LLVSLLRIFQDSFVLSLGHITALSVVFVPEKALSIHIFFSVGKTRIRLYFVFSWSLASNSVL